MIILFYCIGDTYFYSSFYILSKILMHLMIQRTVFLISMLEIHGDTTEANGQWTTEDLTFTMEILM